MPLEIFWFILIGILMTMYAILDGFDLGVGVLHLFARNDRERRIFMNAIGPVWDGNEVWLVTFGGALLGAFPEVFATAFSAFYTPFMVLLCSLIFRAVSLEFRGTSEAPRWRSFWDGAFSLASTAMAFLFGVAVANTIVGLPINEKGHYVGTMAHTLSPFALLVGLLTVGLFALHGAIFLSLKTEGELQEWVGTVGKRVYLVYVALYAGTTAYTLMKVPRAVASFHDDFHLDWLALALNLTLILGVAVAMRKSSPFVAFLFSSAHIATLTFLFGAALFPNLLLSSLDPTWHLTIYNASSSQATLANMQRIALLGAPLAILYTSVVYWLFRGKVKLDEHSY
jgi:cytochrome bd ubiquinol oxidase subunit II